ncbi:ABC transporter permease [Saccharothrix australiensis]|uniref:Peptide/nickel transport system permease protein n=1 Tax=Saccharothrix australiensis TaxID=2072 RepID=A0A495VUF8_9PSEU|nr:ABC transporter permease [Saccharothrix australiensis]RKT52065.1 peptide/nickel transport system permease protein [Saccharothrix australiensis]
MLRYTIRRLIQLVGVVLVLSLLLFAWLRALPGGPVSALLGERSTPESREALTKLLGLDQPIIVQYFKFLGRAASGDFGTSLGVQQGDSAMEIFLQRFPATIELSALAIVIAIALGIPLGYLAAKRRGGWFDNVSVAGSLIGVAVPVFFLAYVLKDVLSSVLGLPTEGRQDAINATRVTGFFVFDGVITGEWDAALNALEHLILPAIALSTIPFAVVFRITRAAVLDVLDEDFVRTAESKGLTAPVIRRRHVLRNAMLPVVTTIGLQTGALLAGAVLTEKVFSFAGVGQALAIGFERRDYPVLLVLIIMATVVYVVVNLLVDLSYALIDPRIRTR